MEPLEIKLNKGKNIQMTESEKSLIRAHITHISVQTIVTPIRSPYHKWMHPILVTLSSLILVMLGGASVSYGAGNALPGDALYNFKINVNEKVAGIFIKSKTAKLVYDGKLLKNRMTELKTLENSGALTPENTAILTKAIDTHIEDISKNAIEVAKINPEVVKQVAASISDTATLTKEIIPIKETDATKEVSPLEVKIDLKEIKPIETSTVKTEINTESSAKEVIESVLPSSPLINKLEEEKAHLDSLIETDTKSTQ